MNAEENHLQWEKIFQKWQEELSTKTDIELIDTFNYQVRKRYFGYARSHYFRILEAEIMKREFNSEVLLSFYVSNEGALHRVFHYGHKVKLVSGFIVRMD